MLAKGSYIEPYWSYYPQHTNNKYVIDSVLSPMKVGTLRSEVRNYEELSNELEMRQYRSLWCGAT